MKSATTTTTTTSKVIIETANNNKKSKTTEPAKTTHSKSAIVTKDKLALFKECEIAYEAAKRSLEAMEESLQMQADNIVEEIKGTDTFKALAYSGKRKHVDETSCLICSTDFSLLLLHNDPSMFSTIGHKCMRCAAYCCYKCVYTQTHVNKYYNNSIGYQCGACKFHNYGLVKPKSFTVERDNPSKYFALPPSTGYSTLPLNERKGEMLQTSDYMKHKNTHNENMADIIAFVNILIDDDEYDERGARGHPGSPDYYNNQIILDSPTSPRRDDDYDDITVHITH